jgi:hypothetical protein
MPPRTWQIFVMHPGAGRGEGDGGEVGAVQRLLDALDARGVVGHGRQAGRQGADAFLRLRLVDRVGAWPPHGVHAVRHRVEAAGHGHPAGQRGEQAGVVDDRRGQDLVVHAGGLGLALGQAPHVGGLGAGVRGGYGDDRQAGGHRNGLGQTRGRAAADADQDVRARVGRRLAGSSRDLDRYVHHDLLVTHHDRDLLGDRVGQLLLAVRRDQHDPGTAERLDLRRHGDGRLPGGEHHPLGKGFVGELHQACASHCLPSE